MIRIRKAQDRGQADLGWLKSQHTFSFASYYDPRHMGVSSLRVINDDRVAPNAGFETHGHKDMEIISYVISGTIAHKDSFGNIKTLPAGEFQLMSAGKGIYHSEFNASNTEPLHFLQIWIQPDTLGIDAGYQQKAFEQTSALTAVVTPTGENGTLKVQQDATLYRLMLAPQEQVQMPQLKPQRQLYVQLVEGTLKVNEQILTPGDGAHITAEEVVRFSATDSPVTALVFDLA
ncbi:pirin [Shewanella xiamenensis]|uniref:pirin family protein n=1 Tax=Shewanella xiamenensis TaxID=332186 RepID=UPI001184F3D3|nr:pirin family protein [Shewanella xiamenensis]TVL24500.1 pirin [Shewanella xiamenensis]TVL24937.1 pirin [Shewanella xiamenensis]TVL29492.1 pirin [Shewanella xiamenensis]TVL38746.1 pirin [Shewanella xiamenensis]TVP05625.1 pirin [Shewanella xiamenensis]